MAQPALSTEIDFALPPVLLNEQGQMRTVGIEIEFVGPSAERTVQALQEALGGRLIEEDPHAFALKESAIGDLTVELDSRILHPGKQAGTQKGVLPKIAALFGFAARYLVPCELVTAPIPVDRLQELNRILAILRGVGAKGTQDGPFYAFGLHFNPEIPRRDVATLTAFMKSFALLNPWLRREASPDATRNLLGFADPFPAEYVRRIGDPYYWPDMPGFIDDYLAYNATRNRDLDLLPLLHDFDATRVRAVLPNEKINGRPTFHYRLPDARVSDPGWSIAPDWNRWVCVERLAADREKLDAVGAAYLSFEGEDKSWANVVEQIVRS
ncbi:amidoligase family protein [Microvirga lotononidis]|uniref:Putative amidoligase enzyme n=1 Tax=Microvirga lotononidis TaxID=864069 RepID=I4YME9_9HYPH|nr:amidoligase family protein [Microvirga lotononidis]EIM25141.1 Putative amidoligase enzyme [Microvirga lotononidis]WQO29371.1 amidoligase family protein [Microvirga lotononidis]